MVKNLVLICTQHPDVKKKVDGMGEVISDKEFDILSNMAFSSDDLMYDPTFVCQEGSLAYEKLKNNAWVDGSGRKYDVIKEVHFERKK